MNKINIYSYIISILIFIFIFFIWYLKNYEIIITTDGLFYLNLSSTLINYSFNPHLLPTYRGILSSIYVYTKDKVTGNSLIGSLKKFYKKNQFIKILKLNTPLGSGNVLNTNNCELSVCETRVKNKYVIFSAIDNLVKGASGQAIQNMNKLYNFPEKLGLK